MTKYLKTAAAIGALAFAVGEVSAAQVQGTIDFGSLSPILLRDSGGNAGASFTSVATVDFLNPASQAVVNPSSTLDFAAFNGDTATFQDFNVGSGIGNLWHIDVAPGVSFDLTTSVNNSIGNTFLNISGDGFVNYPGKDITPGTFTLTASRTGGNNQVLFSFAASTTANPVEIPTPDGGATAVLMGLGLLGMGAIARRK